MAENTVKDMTTNFGKLDKFEGHDFRRWPKNMHFLLTTLKVVYVLTTPMPELLKDATVEAIRIRSKWENDDYICRGHILNEDSSSMKFLVSNFNNYKMVNSRPVMQQYNELLRILGQYTQHGLKMDESISVSSIIDKLPHSRKDFKYTLKHGKDDLSLVGKIVWWIDSGATTHDSIPNVQESQMDDHTDDVLNEILEPRKGKRVRKAKSYGFDFQLYLVEGSRDQVKSQYSYCYSIEEDPRTYNEAMQSQDDAF
nr:putative zinc finger, CCHC-type [Tanacetum cinerariifolium]